MNETSINERIVYNGVEIFIKREDLLHPDISGNKYRKLKYNLAEAKSHGTTAILTFGGAYSNHIAALAFAGRLKGFQTIGVIRGDELKNSPALNSTLTKAREDGMRFKFVSREEYRRRQDQDYQTLLHSAFGDFYFLPEGGTNELAVRGCEEILTRDDERFDVVCVSVGTGGTIAGIINSSKPHQKILGFPAVNGDFLKKDIRKFAKTDNWELVNDYNCGGYAKINTELVSFMNAFQKAYNILLDPIYTAKMLFGICRLIDNGHLENKKILAIHTGGIQAIEGMNVQLESKNLTLINIHG